MQIKGLIATTIIAAAIAPIGCMAAVPKFHHVSSTQIENELEKEIEQEVADSISEMLTVEQILNTPAEPNPYLVVMLGGPYVVDGYHDYADKSAAPVSFTFADMQSSLRTDSVESVDINAPLRAMEENGKAFRQAQATIYNFLIEHPQYVDFLKWKLPVPKKFKFDKSAPVTDATKLVSTPELETDPNLFVLGKRYWLHKLEGGVQFSQAYISPNWYQGGNNNLTLLVNALWNVKLNEVFHPELMFESNVQYKLGLYSTAQDKYHKYAISEDLFQWNMKAGVRAFSQKWFYTFTLQFKTQLLNNYGQDSQVRAASFLSPGDLNLGLGMSYHTANKNNTARFAASISPISYNLKTCIDPQVDPTQFNIPAGRKLRNEIGSSAEVTFQWDITGNISYQTRLFAFTNYQYFQADWENTLAFKINRFLSTQIYVHPRFDSSAELQSGRWHHWMLKEILSFGFAYSFASK